LSFLSTNSQNRGCASSARRRRSACFCCSAFSERFTGKAYSSEARQRAGLHREALQLVAQRLDLCDEGGFLGCQLRSPFAVWFQSRMRHRVSAKALSGRSAMK